jgi:hypothetical protein
MPQKAIILDYRCGQNEPSTPFKQIFVLPDDEGERDRALAQLWYETFIGKDDDLDEEDQKDLADVAVAAGDEYGDLIVGEDDYLLVTFLEEPFEIRLGGQDDVAKAWSRAKRGRAAREG